MPEIKILMLTDLHYVGKADHRCGIEKRKVYKIPELMERLLVEVQPADIDLIVLGGDLTDNGKAPGAEEDLEEIRELIGRFHKPVLPIRGNHDCPPAVFEKILGSSGGITKMNGYQLICFSDRYEPGGVCFRDWNGMEKVFGEASASMPVIVFQHSPIYPPIHEDDYPYNLSEAEKVMAYYQKKEVLLCVSGHLHRGIAPVKKGDVTYFTAAAFCEAPFTYAVLHLEGTHIQCECRSLQ